MELKPRLERIRLASVKKPYVYSFVVIALIYLILNYIINKAWVVGLDFLNYNKIIIVPFIIFNILLAALFALNINLFIMRYREFREVSKNSGFSAVGLFSGLLGGICPGCFAGLFPSIFSLFGVSLTLTSLPLYGIEILIAATILLILGAYFMSNPKNTCEVKINV